MSALGQKRTYPPAPLGEGIVHINAQIPHSALYLSVAKQKLDDAQIDSRCADISVALRNMLL